jgi:hypothetical protein
LSITIVINRALAAAAKIFASGKITVDVKELALVE